MKIYVLDTKDQTELLLSLLINVLKRKGLLVT